MKPIQEIYPFFKQLPQKIVITFHQKPDADALGSALALGHFLRQFHHHIKIISPTNWAQFLHWMPGCSKYVFDGTKHAESAQKHIAEAQFIFCLDFNQMARIGKLQEFVEKSTAKKILIDHHEKPDTQSFHYGISIPSKSSTAEMIYDLIVDAGHKKLINKDIATCLYAGIMTDTGSFRFANTTPHVHDIISVLKKQDINHTLIHQYLFDHFTEQRWRFVGHLLLNRLVVKHELKTAIIYVTQSDLEQYQITTGDTEGLVQYPMGIKDIEFVALIVDRTEEIKLSFRSKTQFNVNVFAQQYFQGGGHIMASGGTSHTTLEETIDAFWKAVEASFSDIQQAIS